MYLVTIKKLPNEWMNASATTMVLLCSLRYHCAGSWRGRQLKHGLSLTEYPGRKGAKETDNLNAEVVQVTQGNRGQVVWRLGSGGGGTAWWFGKPQIVWLPGEQGKGRGPCRGGQARLQEFTSRAKELRSYPIASRESLRNFKQRSYMIRFANLRVLWTCKCSMRPQK